MERRFVVLGYVVMPEHFHLLMSEPQVGTPSTAVGSVKQRYAQRVIPRRRNMNRMPVAPAPCKTGKERGTQNSIRNSLPIWQPRFYDFNVFTEKKRIEKLRYMHRNPVKRGLVDKPEDWRWSSFRSYAFGEPGLVKVNDTDILKMRIRKPAA